VFPGVPTPFFGALPDETEAGSIDFSEALKLGLNGL